MNMQRIDLSSDREPNSAATRAYFASRECAAVFLDMARDRLSMQIYLGNRERERLAVSEDRIRALDADPNAPTMLVDSVRRKIRERKLTITTFDRVYIPQARDAVAVLTAELERFDKSMPASMPAKPAQRFAQVPEYDAEF